MAEGQGRSMLVQSLTDSARRDPRIVGLVDYGSRGGRALDEWTDLDVGIFVRDADFEEFTQGTAEWVRQFGEPLLSYSRSSAGHPVLRTVYDGAPLPLRVDVAFRREREAATAFRWPEIPTVVEAVILYDATDGTLAASMQQLATQTLRPRARAVAFRAVGEEFWYYLLDACAKLKRRDQ